MIVHWPYLVLALAMLWFPRQWMRLGKLWRKSRKQRETMERFAQDGANDPDDKSVRLRRELRNKRNYLDALRGLAGTMALWEFSFEAGPERELLVFGLCAAITFAAVLIQSIRWRERITFFAAIFFYAGVSGGLGSYYPGALAFLLVCAINPVIPTPRLFVSAYALLLLPFNFFLGDDSRIALFNTVVLLVPVIWSMMVKRPMVIFTRRRNLMW
ncbi:hypothetical protein [Oleiharenicola sp. Vm1]|uniref:hypothetical protein n=1 Tax=Oleiharenicola sp. Vm1 TaxID=3398393 RepID=UPI0039F5D1CE